MSQDCPVCYESILGDSIRRLECGHILCTTCCYKIDPPKCPMCRKEFDFGRREVYSPDVEETLHRMSISEPIRIPSYESDDYNDLDDIHLETGTSRRRRRRPRTIVGSAPSVLVSAPPLPISPSEAETILAELMGTREPDKTQKK